MPRWCFLGADYAREIGPLLSNIKNETAPSLGFGK